MKKPVFFFAFLIILIVCILCWFNSPFRFIFYGNTNLGSSKAGKAVSVLEEGLKNYPGNPRIIFSLAKAYLSLGEAEQANKILDKNTLSFFRGDKNFQDFLLDLSEANYRSRNMPFTKYFARKYLEYQNKNETSKRVIKNYLRLGQLLPEKSVEIWEEGYNIAHALKEKELKEDLKALLLPKYIQKVEELRLKKHYNDALEVLNKSMVFGKNAEVNYQEAVTLAESGKPNLAFIKFEDALQLDPGNDNYRITYANVLKKSASGTKDPSKKKATLEKIRLLLVSGEDNSRKTNLLNKIINSHMKFKITNGNLKITEVGDYTYPSLEFRVNPVSDIRLKKYKIVFLDENKKELDIYEAPFSENDSNQLIEVTCRNPVKSSNAVNARLFLNDELVTEYTNK